MSGTTELNDIPPFNQGNPGASIAPFIDPNDQNQILIAESNEVDVNNIARAGILGRTIGFAPVSGERILSQANNIASRTLRTGISASAVQLNSARVLPGIGPDISFQVKQGVQLLPNDVIETREIANIGAILTAHGGTGENINHDPKIVGRLWKINPNTGVNEYLQYTNGPNSPVTFQPSSQNALQAFQFVSETNGNFGIMQTFPKHRLELGPSPSDEGGKYGAKLGDYVIIGGLKLHVKNGQLWINDEVVKTEKPSPCCDCHRCRKKYY